MSEQRDEATGGVVPAAGRHRLHRSPARTHAMKVLYDDQEWSVVVGAAQLAGLRPSSYVAAQALMAAQVTAAATRDDGTRRSRAVAVPAVDREFLAELIQARVAVNRYGVNVNQAAAALNSTGQAPVWLEQAVEGARRAIERVDEASGLLARRLRRSTG